MVIIDMLHLKEKEFLSELMRKVLMDLEEWIIGKTLYMKNLRLMSNVFLDDTEY